MGPYTVNSQTIKAKWGEAKVVTDCFKYSEKLELGIIIIMGDIKYK